MSLTAELERRKLVRLRARPDLIFTAQKYEGRTCFVVKDPVSLRYYRFNDQEYFVVKKFDGQTTLEDTQKDFEKAVAANPYKKAADEHPQYLHLFFLDGKPAKPDLEKLESLKANGEEFALKDEVFYLHTPNGFGTSKLAARAMSGLGVDGTARNMRTCKTLVEMAAEL